MDTTNLKKWKFNFGVLLVALFVIVSVLLNNPALSLGIAYGYSSGGGGWVTNVNTSAPKISNITVMVSSSEADITWNTNKSSISWVVYGTTAAYGTENKTTTYNTSHSLTLVGLSPATVYHYSVKAKDNNGNIVSNTDQTFTTRSAEMGDAKIKVTAPTIKKSVSIYNLTPQIREQIIAQIRQMLAALVSIRLQLASIF